MSKLVIIGVLILLGGVLALVYGGFTYTEETHDAKIGPLEFQVKDKEHVNIPVWVGVAGIVGGLALLMYGGRRTRIA